MKRTDSRQNISNLMLWSHRGTPRRKIYAQIRRVLDVATVLPPRLRGIPDATPGRSSSATRLIHIAFALFAAPLAGVAGCDQPKDNATFQGAIIVSGVIVEPPLEFFGIGDDTLRVNGVPIEPVPGSRTIDFSQLPDDEIRRRELHFEAAGGSAKSPDWDVVAAYAESVYVASEIVEKVQRRPGGLVVHWKYLTTPDTMATSWYYDPKRPETREDYRLDLIAELERAVALRRLVIICPGIRKAYGSDSEVVFETAELLLSDKPLPDDTQLDYGTLIELRDLVSCWSDGRAMPRKGQTSN